MSRRKKFKDLNDQDTLWFLNPLTLKIEGLKIKYISGVPIEETLKNVAAKHYVSIEAYRSDVLAQSPDLTAIPTIKYYLDGREQVQLAMVKVQMGPGKIDMPVPFAANREALIDFTKGEAKIQTTKIK